MSGVKYRYPLFLQEEDWQSLVDGFVRRVARFRAAPMVAQQRRVDAALTEAEADSYEDDGDMKYVLHITQEDYAFLGAAVASRFARVDAEALARICHELGLAEGDARPIE